MKSLLIAVALFAAASGTEAQKNKNFTCRAKKGAIQSTVSARSESEAVQKYQQSNPKAEGVYCVAQ